MFKTSPLNLFKIKGINLFSRSFEYVLNNEYNNSITFGTIVMSSKHGRIIL